MKNYAMHIVIGIDFIEKAEFARQPFMSTARNHFLVRSKQVCVDEGKTPRMYEGQLGHERHQAGGTKSVSEYTSEQCTYTKCGKDEQKGKL